MEIENNFNIGDTVFIKHDHDQKPRMIVGIWIGKYDIQYIVKSGTETSYHEDFELTTQKVLHV